MCTSRWVNILESVNKLVVREISSDNDANFRD